MKKIFLFILTSFLFSTFVFAQNNRTVSTSAQNYVISAKAGGVNFVEGSVTLTRADGKSGYLLKTDTLEIGDKVATGTNAKAEILLNPGSYVRLGANSEFEFITTSLDDLKLKLNSGSAMFEVFADNKFAVEVQAQNTKFYLVKSGVYRVDATSTIARIEVWEGKAEVGEANPTVVKEGNAARVNGSQVTVAKFERDNKDSLETWSKARGKELAKITARLEKRALRTSLLNSFRSDMWSTYNSFGLWIYDTSFSGHCFFPFGRGWRSPYGYYYYWDLWNIRLPYYVYYQPIYSGNGTGNGSGNGNVNGQGVTIRDNTPPFQQMQNSGSSGVTRKMEPQIVDNSPASEPTRVPIVVMPPTTSPSTNPGKQP
jgi:hypothetical protein